MTDTAFDPRVYLQQGSFKDVKLGLARTRELLASLGNPQDAVPMVHVGGTNGKGSTSAFLAGILQAAGYKVGLFTSPYIIEFNERIQVNRTNIPEEDLVRITTMVRDKGLAMSEEPTSFEALTAVAFTYFAECMCDIAIVEVGLGGRLDSTNVIEHPLASVITPISLDHTAILGDTLEAIAHEKAGIIKSGSPVFAQRQPDCVVPVLTEAAKAKGTSITYVTDDVQVAIDSMKQVFSYQGLDNLTITLAGTYQPQNAALAITVARELDRQGFIITDEAIRHGLAQTRWPGRFEVVHEQPYIIVDGGHNPQGAQVLADSLATYFPSGGITFVMSVCADKDYRSMIRSIKDLGSAFFVTATTYTDRALSPQELADVLIGQGAQDVHTCASLHDAVHDAVAHAGSDGVVCCFGSLYSVAETMDAIAQLPTA